MKIIYGLKNVETSKIMFSYKTNQGNVKKAFFTRLKDAEIVLRRFVRNKEEWVIVEVAEMHND